MTVRDLGDNNYEVVIVGGGPQASPQESDVLMKELKHYW
jgi:hypothetical protein